MPYRKIHPSGAIEFFPTAEEKAQLELQKTVEEQQRRIEELEKLLKSQQEEAPKS